MTSDSDWTDSDDNNGDVTKKEEVKGHLTPDEEDNVGQPIKRKVSELFGNDSSSDDEQGKEILNSAEDEKNTHTTPTGPDETTAYKTSIFAGESEPALSTENEKELDNELVKAMDASQEFKRPPNSQKRPPKDMEMSIPLINNILEDERQPLILKLPKFLYMESKPFDKSTYEVDTSITNTNDLHLRIFNTMRWKYLTEGQVHSMLEPKMTNTRLIRWSDGSYTIKIGYEQFPVTLQTVTSSRTKYIGVTHQASGIVRTQAAFTGILNVKPPIINSKTHQWLTEAVKDKYQYSKKTKVTVTENDPTERGRRYEKLIMDGVKNRNKISAKQARMDARSEDKAMANEDDNRRAFKSSRMNFVRPDDDFGDDYEDEEMEEEKEEMDDNSPDDNEDDDNTNNKSESEEVATDENISENDDEPDELERLEHILEEKERADKQTRLSLKAAKENEAI